MKMIGFGAGVVIALMAPLTHAKSQLLPYQLSTCTPCHGAEGVSPNPLWPNLAGQHQAYLFKQLSDMKTGKTRLVPVMQALLAPLSDDELRSLAAYYEQYPLSVGRTPKASLKRGEQLYRGGDFKKQITACIACHGPGGEGNAQAGFPALSGQFASYTIQQLKAFKQGTRHNDLNQMMHGVSKHLDDEDMKALAYYIQGLYPRMSDTRHQCCKER